MFFDYNNLVENLRVKLIALFHKYYLPRWMVFIFDGFTILITFYIAYLLRFNFEVNDFSFLIAFHQGIIVTCTYAFFSLIFRSFSGLIRHTTIIDIGYVMVFTGCSMALLLILSIISRNYYWNPVLIVPYSIILIHYVLITLILIFVRITIKTIYQIVTVSYIKKKKIFIYGAGAMGVIVKRVVQSDVKGDLEIAGFFDRKKDLHGRKINGIPVYSPENLNSKFIKKKGIESLIFAIKKIIPTEKSEIIKRALDLGMEVLDVPNVDTWLNGQFQVRQLQKVKLTELLGREPIELNMERIGQGLKNKVILVTGAAGSIGSEIVRQLTRFPVKHLVLMDQAETPMFHLENEIRGLKKSFQQNFILADITNLDKLESIFQEFHPEIVFHAAAYKHVPMMENNPHEAVRVNVGGTHNITALSIKFNVSKFVMISTDKAVNPTNIMGASKRICEMIVQLKAQQNANTTQFVVTRFGNVLGSNGSVIPIFTKQIEEGGPITVTHPEITRYFMTIPEACQLVLEAGFMGKGDEIFVFDMGKPVKIDDLARQMIRLSGLVPDEDIKIEYSGLRPGEKMFEELLADKENSIPTHHPKIMIAKVNKIENKAMLMQIQTLISNIYTFSKEEVVSWIKDLVPEYKAEKNAESPEGSDKRKLKINSILKRTIKNI